MPEQGDSGHRQRLRQRFDTAGLEGFHDYEAVELLLTYAVPRIDVKPLAKRLLARYGTLAGLFDAPVAELCQIEGIGEGATRLLALIRQLQCRYLAAELCGRPLLDRPERVADWLRLELQGGGMEHFGALFVDQQHRLISMEILFTGTVDRAAVYPRNLIKRALELDAKGLLLFHNHPGGTPRASSEDIELTRRIQEACKPLEIRLLDHFLVAGREVLSFRERGWFPE